jgi:predicted alpha-1,6-mannanase (GH76 family)
MLRHLTISALLLFSTAGLAQGESTLYKTIKENYETKADSMVNAFIESFMIKSKGVFNDKYQQYAFNAYWTQAHAMDVIVYCYERHKEDNKILANKYKSYMSLWYNNKANNYAGASTSDGTYRMFENPFTDDMCWITLTLLHMYEATNITKYYTAAKNIFDQYIIKRATEDPETGGLWLPWNTNGDGNGPNACTQSPATLIAAKLYQKNNQEKYLTYAKKLYAYTSKKIVKSDGRVEEPPLTYTQGTFGEACRILYHVTDENNTIKNKYKAYAYTYINYAFTSGRCTNGSNILRDEGHSGDQSIFKAVLIPYAVNFVLDTDMTLANRKSIAEYIQKNTQMLYSKLNWDRYPIVFCNFDWTKPWTGADSDASMGAMCSGTSLLENTARMQKAIIENYQDYQDIIEDIPASYDVANTTGIYSIDGRLVRTPWQGTDNLPQGMYIINGKKVFVK